MAVNTNNETVFLCKWITHYGNYMFLE